MDNIDIFNCSAVWVIQIYPIHLKLTLKRYFICYRNNHAIVIELCQKLS